MRTVLTLMGAVAINLTAFAALEWEALQTQAQVAPSGEVTITQLEEAASLPPLAQAEADAEAGAVSSSL